MNILEDITNYLISEIVVKTVKNSLDPDDDLIEEGIIDSLGIMKLIQFLEKTYGIELVDDEIIPENFQTLTNIIHFVNQKILTK
jgi:acyl carrier protein